MLNAGAGELRLVSTVEEARALKESYPECLLAGERGGLPPEGFDLGNSPRDVTAVRGRTVVFTTSNGSARLIDAYGAEPLLLGSTVNAATVVEYLIASDRDVVLIPAGDVSDPEFDAQEDWAAAAAIGMLANAEPGEGATAFRHWRARIENEGLLSLFESAPHAEKLRSIGLGDDIAYCARMGILSAVPVAVGEAPEGYVCVRSAR